MDNGNDKAGLERIPVKRRSCMGVMLALFGVLVSVFCLLNFSMGVLFEIPDNLPFVGNLDEVFFTMLLIGSLSYLGIEIPLLTRFLTRNQKK